MVAAELLEFAPAVEVKTRIAHVGSMQRRTVKQGGYRRGAHAFVFCVLSACEDVSVRLVEGLREE